MRVLLNLWAQPFQQGGDARADVTQLFASALGHDHDPASRAAA